MALHLDICFKIRQDRNATSMGHSVQDPPPPLEGSSAQAQLSGAPVLLSKGFDVSGSAVSAQVLELCAGQALCDQWRSLTTRSVFGESRPSSNLADPADSSADRTVCVIVFPDL